MLCPTPATAVLGEYAKEHIGTFCDAADIDDVTSARLGCGDVGAEAANKGVGDAASKKGVGLGGGEWNVGGAASKKGVGLGGREWNVGSGTFAGCFCVFCLAPLPFVNA
jgi:hypothetical protein